MIAVAIQKLSLIAILGSMTFQDSCSPDSFPHRVLSCKTRPGGAGTGQGAGEGAVCVEVLWWLLAVLVLP